MPSLGSRPGPETLEAGAPSPVHIGSKRAIKPENFFDFWVRGFRCPLRDMINHISVYKLKLTNYRIYSSKVHDHRRAPKPGKRYTSTVP